MNTDERQRAATDEQAMAALGRGIEQTRSEMSTTIGELEQRLDPSAMGERVRTELGHLEQRMASVLKEGVRDAKDALNEQLLEAKGAVKDQVVEVQDALARGLSGAREAVKTDIRAAITDARTALHGATIGRIENAATRAGDMMNDTRETLIDTVRQNPLPAALAGIGIAWLLMNRSATSRARKGGEPVQHPADAGGAIGLTTVTRSLDAASKLVQQATGAAGHVAHEASDKAGHLLQDAGAAAGHLASEAQTAAASAGLAARAGGVRLERGLQGAFQTNPLALGAVTLGIGAAIGFSLPRTSKEDMVMGGVHERVVQGVASMAHDVAHSLQGP